MIEKCATKIIEWLIKGKYISEVDRNIYLSGMRQMISYILDMLGIIVVGILFDLLEVSILISIMFMLLQRFTGSYHASSRMNCYVESMLLLVINLYVYNRMYLICGAYILIVAISFFTIIILSPVENKNKQLDKIEKNIYHKKAVMTCIVYVFIWFVAYELKNMFVVKVIMLVLCDIVLLQVIGKLNFEITHNK